jgi:hypothetical protein
MGKIHSINISEQKGVKKDPVYKARISSEGIDGDGHSGDWHHWKAYYLLTAWPKWIQNRENLEKILPPQELT